MKVSDEFPRVNYIKELVDVGERAAESAANDPTMNDHHATVLHLGMLQEMYRRLASQYNRLVTVHTAVVEPETGQPNDWQVRTIAKAWARQAVPKCASEALDEALEMGDDDLQPLIERMIVKRPHVSHAARLAIADMQSGNAANCPG